jgi:hypothetical protein
MSLPTVETLRQVADELEANPGPKVFFPKKEKGEKQPIRLVGYKEGKDVAGLLRYIADMLE